MTKEMKTAQKILKELHELLNEKLKENLNTPYSERSPKEFDKLIVQRSTIFAALVIVSDDIQSADIKKETASAILFG